MISLKFFLKTFLLPLPFFVIGLILGSILILKYKKTGKYLLIFSSISLYLSCLPLVSDRLMYSLERTYPSYLSTTDKIDNIIILGCYHITDEALPLTSHLAACSKDRLIEGLRIANLYPNAKIITSGKNPDDPYSNAQVMKSSAIALGIKEHRIIMNESSINTQQEAIHITTMLRKSHQNNGNNTILVTSAYHMKRAMNYFKQNELTPMAAPAGHSIRKGPSLNFFNLNNYIPRTYHLEKTETAWREIMGLTLQKMIST